MDRQVNGDEEEKCGRWHNCACLKCEQVEEPVIIGNSSKKRRKFSAAKEPKIETPVNELVELDHYLDGFESLHKTQQ